MKYGYLKRDYIELFKGWDVDQVFLEESLKTKDKPQLQKMIELLKEGDTVVIPVLELAFRHAHELKAFIDKMDSMKVTVISRNMTFYPPTTFDGQMQRAQLCNAVDEERRTMKFLKKKYGSKK